MENINNSNENIFNNEKIFPEPFRVFEKDSSTLEDAQKNAIIVLDTNILLFPYTVSSHSLSSIESIYQKLISENRLFIPEQVAREFAKNRNNKLGEIYHNISNSKATLSKNKKYPILENLPEYIKLRKKEKELEKHFNEYNQQLKKLSKAIKNMGRNDPVSTIYYNLFSKEQIVHHTKSHDEIKQDLEFRIKNNIPPGYKDSKKSDNGIGDVIIWHTILQLAKEQKTNLIFVSNDEKADWYNQSNGNAFQPRYELIDEYKRISNGNTIYIINFSTFLNLFEIDSRASKEIEKKESFNKSFSAAKSDDFYLSYENKKDEIKKWFFENYDDPANLLPYESKEGGYFYIWGGPYSTDEIIYDNFGGELPEALLQDIIEEIENDYGDIQWSAKPEPYLNLDIHLDYETSERAGAGGMFQVSSIEESEFGYDMTDLIDVGRHYHKIEDVIKEISEKTEVPITNINYEIV